MVRNVARCSLVHASITSAHDLVLADAELIVRGTRDGVGAGIPPSRGLRCSLLVFLRLMRFWDGSRASRGYRSGQELRPGHRLFLYFAHVAKQGTSASRRTEGPIGSNLFLKLRSKGNLL